MANITQITLPNGSTYDIKDSIRGIEYIEGTQTGATGSWTGVSNRPALFNGMMIRYRLPYAGSGNASLNLTLSDGTATGDKPVYLNNASRVTTHFPANSIVPLTYSTKLVSTGAWYADTQYWYDTLTSAYCSTAAATAAKAASCTNYNLKADSYIHIVFTATNTAASALTLNISSKGAKPLYINGLASSSTNYTLPAGSYILYYDGTNYYARTDGVLPTGGVNIKNKVSMQYNATTDALDFIFA